MIAPAGTLRTRRLLAAALIALAGCTDVLPPDDGDDDDFSITISSGTQPTYTWQGGPARRIDVLDTSDPTFPVWAVTTIAFPHMPSPVRHGTVPPGAVELSDDETTLRSGVNYRVRITLADNSTSSRDFRP